jgi:serine phosphatase RsbU (regulator of sigma subunit)
MEQALALNYQETILAWIRKLYPKVFYKQQDIIEIRDNTGKGNKSRELQDSIIYAKRIQEGMMLKEKHLQRLFPQSFLLFEPKDIVSGDFYWFTRLDDKIVVATADCTGHGIPGAFMSVLGISLLNQIVIEERQTNPELILQRLDHKVKKAFAYSVEYVEENRNYDGMDISLVVIDQHQMTVDFCGALRPLYLVQNNVLKEFRGSRFPIGGWQLEEHRIYKGEKISYNKGDKIYLCSDGFADQFGGPLNKKYMSGRFKNLLQQTSKYSMNTQFLELRRHLNEWKNNTEQTDDILLLGLQL